MKILYYSHEKKLRPAVLTPHGIIDINRFTSTKENGYHDSSLTIEELQEVSKAVESFSVDADWLIDESSLVIGPCAPNPGKIICVGLNYRRHAVESGMEIPKVPVVFTKYNNTLTGYNCDVPLGREGEQFDYEVELGVIIGKKCKNVSRENALKYVLGYCVANDLSCRDLQFKTSQWVLGKSLDHFLPLGKYFVTPDELANPQNLRLTCKLNGELRQDSNTRDMIFSVAEIIEFLSRYMTLQPGDLILTGTPEGVIMGREQKNWLKPGDSVTVEIEQLGYAINKMI